MTVSSEHPVDRPQKVVAYIVRDERIVVLRHADQPWDQAGLQVPAGTVRPGETPEDAVLREAREETGLLRRAAQRLSADGSSLIVDA